MDEKAGSIAGSLPKRMGIKKIGARVKEIAKKY